MNIESRPFELLFRNSQLPTIINVITIVNNRMEDLIERKFDNLEIEILLMYLLKIKNKSKTHTQLFYTKETIKKVFDF